MNHHGEMNQPSVLQVFIFREGRFSGTDCFTQPTILVGREPGCDLHLDDDLVSRYHASVCVTPEGILFEDLGSANGAFLNGRSVTHCTLGPWDEISIGVFTLKFKQLSPGPSVAETGPRPCDREATVRKQHPRDDTTEVVPTPRLEDALVPHSQTSTPPALALSAAGTQPSLPLQFLEPVPSPPAPEVARDDDDDDDDDDERTFVEPFSLLRNLVRTSLPASDVHLEQELVAEIISYNPEKTLTRYDQVARRGKHLVGPNKFTLVDCDAHGNCRLLFDESFSGAVITSGRTVALEELLNMATRIPRRLGPPVYVYPLHPGDFANIVHPGGGSFLRFVRPPRLPRATSRKIDRAFVRSLGSSAALHLLVIAALGVFSARNAAGTQPEPSARISFHDRALSRPEVAPEIPHDQLPPREEPLPQNPSPAVVHPKLGSSHDLPATGQTNGGHKTTAGDPGGGAGLRNALANLRRSEVASVLGSVSNIDAVAVPGNRGLFKQSGIVSKLATSEPILSRGREVGVKGDIDLLRPGKGKKGLLGPGILGREGTGERPIRATVFLLPVPHQPRGTGVLTSDEINAVVKSHRPEIQYCYERSLMLNPKLEGKVIMEWTIGSSGSVTLVKLAFSSLPSSAVASCLSARIREWKFPPPRGTGVVVVTYPFLFSQVGL